MTCFGGNLDNRRLAQMMCCLVQWTLMRGRTRDRSPTTWKRLALPKQCERWNLIRQRSLRPHGWLASWRPIESARLTVMGSWSSVSCGQEQLWLQRANRSPPPFFLQWLKGQVAGLHFNIQVNVGLDAKTIYMSWPQCFRTYQQDTSLPGHSWLIRKHGAGDLFANL